MIAYAWGSWRCGRELDWKPWGEDPRGPSAAHCIILYHIILYYVILSYFICMFIIM